MELLQRGDIVYIITEDKNGHKKPHPAVLISHIPDDDDGPILAFIISGQYKIPNIVSEIFLQADLDGKIGTNTKRDCAVICT